MAPVSEKLGILPGKGRLVGLMDFTLLTSGVASIMLGSLLPRLQQAGGLDYAQSGGLLSAHYVGNLAAMVLAGLLSRLAGRKGAIVVLGSGAVAGYLILARSTSPLLLALAFAAVGLSRGGWSSVGSTVVGGAAQKGVTALNLLHACFALGGLTSPFVLLALGRLGGAWQAAAWFVVGLAGLVVLLTGASSLPLAPEKPGGAAVRPAVFLRSPAFWLSAATLFFYVGAEASITGWLVSYFGQAGRLPERLVPLTPSLLWGTMLVGRLLCAVLARRLGRSVLLLAMGVLFTLFFVLMLWVPTPVLVVLCLLLTGLCMAGIFPTAIGGLSPFGSTLATGLGMSLGAAGGILLPGLVGLVADGRGLSGGVAIVAVFCAALVGVGLLDLARARREKEAAP